MRPVELASLVLMAALWGGSFAFQRVLSPLIGPVPLTCLRLVVAGLFLVVYATARRERLTLLRDGAVLFLIGLLSSGVPYTLFAYGALHLSSALLAVLNATAPMFGAVFSAIWLKERLNRRQAAGLLLGAAGVAVVSEVWGAHLGPGALLGVAACLAAAACYGLGGVVVTLKARDVSALTLATGGQLYGGLALVPFAVALWPVGVVPDWVWPTGVLFGVVCSAVPFLAYMWLLGRVGATRALTVTFLIPVFGALWGSVILHEPLTLAQVVGGVVILAGTLLVVLKPLEKTPAAKVQDREADASEILSP